MMKRYLTIGLAMACFVGKAETVTVRYHIVNERQEPVCGAQVKTTTERDALNLSCVYYGVLSKTQNRKELKL